MQIFPNVFVFVSGDARCEIKPFVMLNFLLFSTSINITSVKPQHWFLSSGALRFYDYIYDTILSFWSNAETFFLFFLYQIFFALKYKYLKIIDPQ